MNVVTRNARARSAPRVAGRRALLLIAVAIAVTSIPLAGPVGRWIAFERVEQAMTLQINRERFGSSPVPHGVGMGQWLREFGQVRWFADSLKDSFVPAGLYELGQVAYRRRWGRAAGQLHGAFRLFDGDRLILLGAFEDGRPSGTWTLWNLESGLVDRQADFADGDVVQERLVPPWRGEGIDDQPLRRDESASR